MAQPQCCHDHECDEDCGLAFSLYKHIDIPQVRCLNEATEGACQNVFKPWERRLEFDGASLRGDGEDPELLLHIPFDGDVKIKSLTIVGGPDGSSPESVKLFVNRDDLDFSLAHELEPVQEFTLVEDFRGVLEYPTRVTKFQGVHCLTLFFPGSLGADYTQIFFIGLKGEHTERKREPVHAVYELKPVGDASEVPGAVGGSHQIM